MATIKPKFNERLYEFCVNADLVTNLGALIAGYLPGIPSPQEEGKWGWDAKIPMPALGRTFLLQYKIAKRTTARAGPNVKFWDTYGDEYYRFNLHRDAAGAYTQHQLLLNAQGGGVEALYCAPMFHAHGDLVASMQAQTVLDDSALIPLASLGPASAGAAHSVSYPADSSKGAPTLHSEPRRGERLRWEELSQRQSTPSALDEEAFGTLSESIINPRRRRKRRDREFRAEDPRAEAYLRASAAAFDEVGATLVVLPQGE